MEERHRKKIEEIMGQMHCPKNFECYHSGFQSICKATDEWLKGGHICCGEDRVGKCGYRSCPFCSSFGGRCYCTCPLHLYITKIMKK